MANISVFPTISKVVEFGEEGALIPMTAGVEIKGGQVVVLGSSPTSFKVYPFGATGAGTKPIGVALYDASVGDPVSVAINGAIVYVANLDDTSAIAADALVAPATGGTVYGCVKAQSEAAETKSTMHWCVGRTLESIAGSSTGRILINCWPITTGTS